MIFPHVFLEYFTALVIGCPPPEVSLPCTLLPCGTDYTPVCGHSFLFPYTPRTFSNLCQMQQYNCQNTANGKFGDIFFFQRF